MIVIINIHLKNISACFVSHFTTLFAVTAKSIELQPVMGDLESFLLGYAFL
jgi:hypothetical protein